MCSKSASKEPELLNCDVFLRIHMQSKTPNYWFVCSIDDKGPLSLLAAEVRSFIIKVRAKKTDESHYLIEEIGKVLCCALR